MWLPFSAAPARFQIGFLVCSVEGSELVLFLQLFLKVFFTSVCHLPVSDWWTDCRLTDLRSAVETGSTDGRMA